MIHPRIDDLLEKVDGSRYGLVIVAAKRARQINNYHHQLGEGIGFDEAPPPLIESRSKNYLTMAMEEIARGKITYNLPA
ncbi:MAG TPA: DNA-directed RNA polymerase subunit omega [Gaiellaceae bacterium]|jgi:DNA-directed RNA polymerase subunit omega|nr:DNA-directed RNA polymerase subunit omega [Gaiellaceae bacterium]